MSGFLPLRPGLWWMRRWHLPGKLVTLGVVMAGALAMAAVDAPWWAVALAAAVVLYALCALYAGLASDLQGLAHAMEQTTRGDLCARAGVYGRDEVGSMAQSLDRMVLTLSSMVADIRSNAALVAHAGQSLAQGNRADARAAEVRKAADTGAEAMARAVQSAEALEHRASTLSQAVAAFRLQQGTADEAVALVNKAVALHKTSSRDQFLRSITDKTQPYHDRDMYVFVLDAGGTYLAFGGNPAKVGTRVQDIPGIAGDRLVSDIVTQADRAPGWVEYDINNPATGAVQTKMSYVSRVGDWYVGCGVYKSLAAR
eukprot:gene8703-8794_t